MLRQSRGYVHFEYFIVIPILATKVMLLESDEKYLNPVFLLIKHTRRFLLVHRNVL